MGIWMLIASTTFNSTMSRARRVLSALLPLQSQRLTPPPSNLSVSTQTKSAILLLISHASTNDTSRDHNTASPPAVTQLSELIHNRRFHDARRLLESIALGRDPHYDPHPFPSIVSSLVTAGEDRWVLSKAVDMLFGIYSDALMHRTAYEAFEFAVSRLGGLPEISCLAFLLSLKRSKRMDLAVRFFRRLLDARGGGGRLIVSALGMVVEGLCKGGDIGGARELFEEMRGRGIEPDVFTYNVLLQAYCKAKDFNSVGGLLRSIDENGVARDEATYTILVRAYSKYGKFGDAERAFSDMNERGVRGDVHLYTAMIDASCKAGNLERARTLLDECVERGLQPNVYTYGALIHGHCKLGQMEAAEMLMGEMQRKGVGFDKLIFKIMIDGYCKNGSAEKALETKVVMEKKGFKLDKYSDICLRKCLAGHGTKTDAI